jgi:hypothetical protein
MVPPQSFTAQFEMVLIAAAALPRERRDGFLRAVAAAVPPDPTDSDLLGRPAERSAILRRARATEMSELPDDMIKEIAARVAKANSVSVSSVQTSSTVDSSGSSAIEIKFVLTPGSSAAIMGLPSALTTSQVIQRLADAGEERLPIVRYEELGATSTS